MDLLIFYNKILYLILRCIGLGISIEFYYKIKKKRLKRSIIGWLLWIISSIFSITSNLTDQAFLIETLFLLEIIFGALGVLFYIWTIFSYFSVISFNLIYILTFLIIILPLISMILGNYHIGFTITIIIVSVILSSLYFIPALNWEKFKVYMGSVLKTYYTFLIIIVFEIILSIYVSLQIEIDDELNFSEQLIVVLNDLSTILFYILSILLLIHMEYNYAYNQQYQLRDKYSHDLGNILQFITGYIDIRTKNDKIERDKENELQNLFIKKTKEANDILREIREL